MKTTLNIEFYSILNFETNINNVLRKTFMKIIPLGLLFLMNLSCKNYSGDSLNEFPDTEDLKIEIPGETEALANIKIGKIKKENVSNYVECTGTVNVAPGNFITVSSKVGGYLNDIKVISGDYVQAGQPLFAIEDAGFIELQQKYIESKARYEYLKNDLKRQGELALEDAASIKVLEKATSDFEVAEVLFFSLEQQIILLGINPETIKSSTILSKLIIHAPVSGYITEFNFNTGDYVQSDDIVLRLLNNKNQHLELRIYENELLQVERGQRILFSLIDNDSFTYEAKVKNIGKYIHDNRTIEIHGEIDYTYENLLPGMFVKAKILTNDDLVYVIPKSGVVVRDSQHFLFIKDGKSFMPFEIFVKNEFDEFYEVELINDSLLTLNIVMDGAYYLNSFLEEE